MDCPLCGNSKLKVRYTTKWPTMDVRKHECLNCSHKFSTIAMNIEFEALLEAAALVTREWYMSRETYHKKNDGTIELLKQLSKASSVGA